MIMPKTSMITHLKNCITGLPVSLAIQLNTVPEIDTETCGLDCAST